MAGGASRLIGSRRTIEWVSRFVWTFSRFAISIEVDLSRRDGTRYLHCKACLVLGTSSMELA